MALISESVPAPVPTLGISAPVYLASGNHHHQATARARAGQGRSQSQSQPEPARDRARARARARASQSQSKIEPERPSQSPSHHAGIILTSSCFLGPRSHHPVIILDPRTCKIRIGLNSTIFGESDQSSWSLAQNRMIIRTLRNRPAQPEP